ncbi:putative ATP-dependent RNA helicase ddx5 [Cichlidogyrus casuarinus]|uniref:RNA helicase n=1 Tax=Cichlidogyrus casuarinus TaxID=1844966 RepID=A0ABD2Q761_9PLAT
MSRIRRDFSRSPPRRSNKRNDIKELSPVDWRRYRLVEHVKERYKEKSVVRDRSPRELQEYLESNQITVKGKNAPNPILLFSEAPFDKEIVDVIEDNEWDKPTPIQSVAWPILLTGCDVVGIARTGGGKTATFLLPAIQHILAQPKMVKGDGPICLILVPTRELAMQVNEVCSQFCKPLKIMNVAVYGGAKRRDQGDGVRSAPEIVVATPGRLIDFMNSRDTNLRRCTYLVLDEADRMLDMGFEPSIRMILPQVRPDHQTVMFSATWPKGVEKLARSFMVNPYHIKIGSHDLHANKNIKQNLEFLDSERDKFAKLKDILKMHKKEKGIIFVETKRRCDTLAFDLRDRGYDVAPMHGDKVQAEREDILKKLRSGRLYVLIATDVASRGLVGLPRFRFRERNRESRSLAKRPSATCRGPGSAIPRWPMAIVCAAPAPTVTPQPAYVLVSSLYIDDISYVVNYDYPTQTEDYVHRIGRTARSDNTGTAYTFLENLNPRKARELLKLMEDSDQDIPHTLYQMAGLRRKRSVSSSAEEKRRKRSASANSSSSGSSAGVVKRRKRSSTSSSDGSEAKHVVSNGHIKRSGSMKIEEVEAPPKAFPYGIKRERSSRSRSEEKPQKKAKKSQDKLRSASVDSQDNPSKKKKAKKEKKHKKKKSKKSKKSKKHRHSSVASSN